MDDKVMIGDYLGTIEEFMPGDGTFEEDGKIYAAKMGVKSVDAKKHLAEVKGKTLPSLKLGDVVFGEVVSVKNNNVIVIAGKILGQKGAIDERTLIYVSNISDSYVDKPDNVFAVGDIVKAKVIKKDDNLTDLSTKGGFGVVKAFCKRCRHPLVKSDKGQDKLKCSSCARIEKRQVASDYGNVCEM